MCVQKLGVSIENSHNKRFKRDFQRVAFLLCVGFCGYGVMRKLGSSVVSPLSGRYAQSIKSVGCECRFPWHFVQVLSAIQYCLSLPNEAAMYLAL